MKLVLLIAVVCLQRLLGRVLKISSEECEEDEICRVDVIFGLQTCSCPGSSGCPTNVSNSFVYKGARYQWCNPVDLPICKDGDIAWTTKGYRQKAYCVCPENLGLRNTEWKSDTDIALYKCVKKELCTGKSANCSVRLRLPSEGKSHFKCLCDCPLPFQCTEIENSTITEGKFELDLFQCT